MKAPTLEDIRATSKRLARYVERTPTIGHPGGIEGAADLFLKLELFQRTGTFKFRGALNQMLGAALKPGQGVTAVSAGNHAVAVSCAAAMLEVEAKVVVLSSANPARRALAESYGSELIYRESGADAFATAERLVEEEGRFFVHPFDGPHVAEATGGVGLELMNDVPALEAVVIAVGGGGLAGGAAAAVKLTNPECAVYGVEPEGADGMRRSFEAGRPLSGLDVHTIADSLGPPMTTEWTYGLCRRFVDEIVTVTDDDLCRAMALLFRDVKLAVEPSGAAALAARIGPLKTRLEGKRVGLIVCGACIDWASYSRYLERGLATLRDTT